MFIFLKKQDKKIYTVYMFIQVKLLNGFQRPLWYRIPDRLQQANLQGTIVQVPLRNRIVPAVVIDQKNQAPKVSFAIKEIIAVEPFPSDKHYSNFITQLGKYHQIEPIHFIKRMRQFLKQKEVKPQSTNNINKLAGTVTRVSLTHEQQAVYNFIQPHITQNNYTHKVLHGVTGSGKTEVYKNLITHTINLNKNALLLLPEVTLAIAFEKRIRTELENSITICGFHSATSPKEKRLLWQYLLEKKPILIIGVHLPILLPIANLGLIIIDEEHDVGYQEKKHPKINSKEAAIWRAKLHNIPIVLGSATPSIATLYNVKTRGWHFFQLKKRFAGNLPTIHTVLLTDKKQRKNFWISRQLQDAIKNRLAKKEQVIIFLNRRGFSFFVQCKQCSFIFTCTSCSVSLTLHKNNMLTCHYCGSCLQQPSYCPSCKADESNLLKKGIGTQQVVSILEQLFPHAHIARADLDTTVKKKQWQQTMQNFIAGTIDILVGTQTITKGYDFPNVTLVGVLWADLNLNFPIFNAAETTLQQLIQVAGRAGRQHKQSTVIVQAMSDHKIFAYLNETDYLKFYHDELFTRKEIGYPPCKRLVEIELKHTDETIIEREAHDITMALFTHAKEYQEIQVLGPAKPPVHKIKNTFARKIYIKGVNMNDMIALFNYIDKKNYASSIFFTPNPVT